MLHPYTPYRQKADAKAPVAGLDVLEVVLGGQDNWPGPHLLLLLIVQAPVLLSCPTSCHSLSVIGQGSDQLGLDSQALTLTGLSAQNLKYKVSEALCLSETPGAH